MNPKKKLIEVALPLEAINKASAREKSIRHGHPSTLHLWWARRPLAACRAVLFAQLVDDPSAHPDKFPTEEAQEAERQRLFRIIEDLVKWENSTNERVLQAARAEILKSTDGQPPPVYDPFCGGGSIPLEAQRLGLEAYASDLNPVPVLITKALIEIPPRFIGMPPVNPDSHRKLASSGSWKLATGLAEDIRYYGQWMRDEAEKRIGHLYPKVKLSREYGGGEATVIAWLWARTVASPNPVVKGAHVPLVRSFWLSTKVGKKAWVEPVVDIESMTYRFEVRTGNGKPPPGTMQRTGGICLLTGSPITREYIRSEGRSGRMCARLMAIVAEGNNGRIYLPPDSGHVRIAESVELPDSLPDTALPERGLGLGVQIYGMTKHQHLFTNRQLVAITTFCDLVSEARGKVLADSNGNQGYADAIATYLGLCASKASVFHTLLARWRTSEGKSAPAFGRQAVVMVWDFAEVNPFAGAGGDFSGIVNGAAKAIDRLPAFPSGNVVQLNATRLPIAKTRVHFSTDPPYYDNVPYADLSDCFYIWLRRCLQPVYPKLLGTVLVPKAEELVADPFRHGGKNEARSFFEHGMGRVFERMQEASDLRFPTTIYYAFKQAEEDDDEDIEGTDTNTSRISTGWETFLQSLTGAGWQIDGTWPMRTEGMTRMRNMASNALASSIVLVCRPRPYDAPITTRRDFLKALKRELPDALKKLQHGNIAPVDLAQSAIGPGMAIFTRYAKVLESDDSPMTVRTALQLINQALDEYLSEQEGEYDANTRFAITWFETHGMEEGPYGVAETLATARGVSVSGVQQAGILQAKCGKVRLLKREEMPDNWDPATDTRLTVWEAAQHLIRTMETKGEVAAGELITKLGSIAEIAHDLAYRLYGICEKKKWADEALAYNGLVIAWPELTRLAAQVSKGTPSQPELGF